MKKLIFIIPLLVLMVGFIAATNCPPSIPKTYSGEAYFKNGGDLFKKPLDDAEYPLRAVMGSETVGIGKVLGGNYSIKISPCSGVTGNIVFIINGIESNQEGVYSGQDDWGENEALELVFSPKPPVNDTCGDNAIQIGEECDGVNLGGRDPNSCGEGWEGTISCSASCTISYSQCTLVKEETNGRDSGNSGSSSSGSGSGSSGGGGGGGFVPVSTENESNNTLGNSVSNNPDSEEESNSNSTESSSQTSQENPPGIFGITGLAIGDFARTDAGKGVLTVIILAVILGVIYFAKKKYSKDGKKKGNNKSSKKKSNGSGKKKTSGKKTKNVKTVKMSDLKNRKK